MNKNKSKKILVIHTHYREKGGEDIAVDEEVKFLSKFYNVDTLFFSNKFEKKFIQSLFLILNYNFFSLRKLNQKDIQKNNDVFFLNGSMYYNDISSFLKHEKFIFNPNCYINSN